MSYAEEVDGPAIEMEEAANEASPSESTGSTALRAGAERHRGFAW